MAISDSRSHKRPIPHARLFGKRLRVLREDHHVAHLLKQNLELKALVRAMAETLLAGCSPKEARRILKDVLRDQRRIFNEAATRHAIKEADSVDDLMAMLHEIDEADTSR